jgi:hypothetical protein
MQKVHNNVNNLAIDSDVIMWDPIIDGGTNEISWRKNVRCCKYERNTIL